MSNKRRFPFWRGRDAPEKRSAIIGGVKITDEDGMRALLQCGYKPVMECAEIQRCINVYAHLIGNMTIRLLQNTEDGDKRVYNQLSRRVDIAPSPHTTRANWIETIVRLMLSRGNAFVEPIYRNGYLNELFILPKSETTLEEISARDYRVHRLGKTYRPEQLVNFVYTPDENRAYKGKGFSGIVADVVKSLRMTGTAKQAIQSAAFPSLIVKVDGYTQELQSEEGRDKIAEKYITSKEAGKPWVLAADAFSVEQIKPLSLNDLAIRDSLEIDLKSAAALTGVPTFMLGVGTFNREEYQNFVATELMHVAQIIDQTLTRDLLISQELHFSLNPMSLLNYSFSDLVAGGKEMVDRTALTRNEWRDMIGLPPDERMSELIALENYIPVARLGDQKKLKGGEHDAEQPTDENA